MNPIYTYNQPKGYVHISEEKRAGRTFEKRTEVVGISSIERAALALKFAPDLIQTTGRLIAAVYRKARGKVRGEAAEGEDRSIAMPFKRTFTQIKSGAKAKDTYTPIVETNPKFIHRGQAVEKTTTVTAMSKTDRITALLTLIFSSIGAALGTILTIGKWGTGIVLKETVVDSFSALTNGFIEKHEYSASKTPFPKSKAYKYDPTDKKDLVKFIKSKESELCEKNGHKYWINKKESSLILLVNGNKDDIHVYYLSNSATGERIQDTIALDRIVHSFLSGYDEIQKHNPGGGLKVFRLNMNNGTIRGFRNLVPGQRFSMFDGIPIKVSDETIKEMKSYFDHSATEGKRTLDHKKAHSKKKKEEVSSEDDSSSESDSTSQTPPQSPPPRHDRVEMEEEREIPLKPAFSPAKKVNTPPPHQEKETPRTTEPAPKKSSSPPLKREVPKKTATPSKKTSQPLGQVYERKPKFEVQGHVEDITGQSSQLESNFLSPGTDLPKVEASGTVEEIPNIVD